MDAEAVQRRPALAATAGAPLVLGIRPDATEDAALARDVAADRRMPASVELRETVGSEAYVHFKVDAPPVVTEDTRELASDMGDEMLERLEDNAAERRPRSSRARTRARPRARASASSSPSTRGSCTSSIPPRARRSTPDAQPFSPLSEIPRMKFRWKIMNTTIIGSVAITEPAISMSHAVRFLTTNSASPSGAV